MYRTEEACVDHYRKYASSTAVLAALGRMVTDHQSVGTLFGITKDIKITSGVITPDVSARGSTDREAILFELKWSLTTASAREEILNLKRYVEAEFSWSGQRVETKDIVLVVNHEDAEIVLQAAKDLLAEGNAFLENNFSIWEWFFSASSETEEASLWFRKLWGSCSNKELEGLVKSASGYRTPSDVLTYLRWMYRFTKDKPPVQYTIGIILMHVLATFRTRTDQRETLEIKEDLVDPVYERAKVFFPVKDPPQETVQIRKRWIREAFSTMRRISLKEIRIPFSTRDLIEVHLCRKLRESSKRRPVGRPKGRTRRPKPSPFDTKLD